MYVIYTMCFLLKFLYFCQQLLVRYSWFTNWVLGTLVLNGLAYQFDQHISLERLTYNCGILRKDPS